MLNMIDGKSRVRYDMLIFSMTKVHHLGKQGMQGGISKELRELVDHLNIDLDILPKNEELRFNQKIERED